MTVSKLIKELQKMPQNLTVSVEESYYENCHVTTVERDTEEYLDTRGRKKIREVVMLRWSD